MGEQGRKFDGGKLRYDLVPVLAFEDQVKGLTYGATKYDDNNWRNVPEGRKRYMAAAIRHLQEYRKGNIWDDEQGIHHLSAAINNFSFIVEKDLQGWEDSSEEGVSEVVQDFPDVDTSLITEKLWYPDDSGEWIETSVCDFELTKTKVGDSMIECLADWERKGCSYAKRVQGFDWWFDCEYEFGNRVAYKIVKG